MTQLLRPLLLTLVCALAACGPLPPSQGGGDSTPGSVNVALLVPLGSEDGELETLGRALVNAAELARDDLSGVTLELKVYNTAGDAAQAAEATRNAVAEGAEVLLGPLFSPATAAAAPEARGLKVLSFSNNDAIAGGNVYLLGTSLGTTAARITGYTVGQGFTQLAVVHPEGIEGEISRDAVIAAAGPLGGQVVATGAYPLSVEGIATAVPGIARQLRGAGANAVMLTDGPTGGLTFVAETLRGLGLREGAVQFAGTQRWDTSAQALAQPALKGGWFAAPDPATVSAFEARYAARFGTPPHPLAGLAYDGMAAIGALAKANPSAPFSEAALTAPQGFAGVLGVFRFGADGRGERALAVLEVADGEARVVDPAPRSFTVRGF